ncbi:glycosyltransferase family 2 protein [Colwellia sp. E150_009]
MLQWKKLGINKVIFMIKYSVIIPHYQDVLSLHKLLDTIPERSDIEIIVVDDKSSLPESQTKELKSRCIYLENNTTVKSAGTCRNIGVTKATGDWLVFADSDDLFPEGAFTKFDAFNSGEFDIVYFEVTSLNSSTQTVSDRHFEINELINNYNINKDEAIIYSHVVPWGKLISRVLICKHNIKFDEVIASNDVMFSLKAATKAIKIKVTDQLGYIVVRREGSLTKVKSVANMKSRLGVILERNKYLLNLNKKQYQISFISILLQYRNVLSISILLNLFFNVIMMRQRFFPHLSSISKFKRLASKAIKQEF